MEALVALLLLIIWIPISFVLAGITFSTFWGWFITPIFGLPEIGFWAAIGILVTIRIVTTRFSSVKSSDNPEEILKETFNFITLSLITYVMFWVMAGFAKLFI